MAISPPVPVPTIKSKWSHGLGISCLRGARPSISTNVLEAGQYLITRLWHAVCVYISIHTYA